MSKLKIIHYDNQFLSRAGFKYLVTETGNFRLVGSFESKENLLAAVEKQLPNVVVFDFTSKDSLTSEDLIKLSKVSKKPGFLVISNDFKKETICEYMDCGVECFITKECSKDEILQALQAAAKGEKFFCNKVLNYIIERTFAPKDDCDATPLTKRELEILKLTANGLSNKNIADKLFLSLHTVYTHRKNIIKKLNIKSGSEFIKYAYETRNSYTQL